MHNNWVCFISIFNAKHKQQESLKACESDTVSCSVVSLLFATTWTVAHQVPLWNLCSTSIPFLMEYPRQEYCHLLLRGSSQPRDRTQVSCIAGRFLAILGHSWPSEPPGKPCKMLKCSFLCLVACFKTFLFSNNSLIETSSLTVSEVRATETFYKNKLSYSEKKKNKHPAFQDSFN